MLAVSSNRIFRMFVELVLFALLTFVVVGALASWASARTLPAPQKAVDAQVSDARPTLRDYRGVQLGMTQAEARAKLGDPADKSDAQDYFAISDQEIAQVFYDAAHTVNAVSVTYLGAQPPTSQAVLGEALTPASDGSVYKLVKYTGAGYWVSYSRTAGASPVVTVTLKKL